MDLTRNESKLVLNLTSADSSSLSVTHWESTDISAFRTLTSAFTLGDSTQIIHFPAPKDGKTMFLVGWGATQEETTASPKLVVTAGGWRSALGDYSVVLAGGATGATTGSTGGRFKRWIFGPFESAQFQCSATATAGGCSTGDPCIKFDLSSVGSSGISTNNYDIVSILPINLPDVSYDT